jgi:hypothetical protein
VTGRQSFPDRLGIGNGRLDSTRLDDQRDKRQLPLGNLYSSGYSVDGQKCFAPIPIEFVLNASRLETFLKVLAIRSTFAWIFHVQYMYVVYLLSVVYLVHQAVPSL